MLDYLRRPERSLTALRALLRQAAAAASVDASSVAVLLLGDCAWLVRPSLLCCTPPAPQFVLLAGGEARWASEAEAECLRSACAGFFASLSAALERGETSPRLEWSTPPPTLHGALLGYPAVYALDGPAGPLSLELGVLQLRTTSIPPAVISSFSVPCQLLGCEELERCALCGVCVTPISRLSQSHRALGERCERCCCFPPSLDARAGPGTAPAQHPSRRAVVQAGCRRETGRWRTLSRLEILCGPSVSHAHGSLVTNDDKLSMRDDGRASARAEFSIRTPSLALLPSLALGPPRSMESGLLATTTVAALRDWLAASKARSSLCVAPPRPSDALLS